MSERCQISYPIIIRYGKANRADVVFYAKTLALMHFSRYIDEQANIKKQKTKNKNCGLFSLYDIHHNKKPRFIGVLLCRYVPFSTSLCSGDYRLIEPLEPIGRGMLRVACTEEIREFHRH